MYGVERSGFGLFGYRYMWELGILGPHSANKELQPRPYKAIGLAKKTTYGAYSRIQILILKLCACVCDQQSWKARKPCASKFASPKG